MSGTQIDPLLLERMAGAREQVREVFEMLRKKQRLGDKSGKDRLEYVPPLLKRHFKSTYTGKRGQVLKVNTARDFLRFIEGDFALSASAREALDDDIDRQLDTLRTSPAWLALASDLADALGIPKGGGVGATARSGSSAASYGSDSALRPQTAPTTSYATEPLNPILAPSGKRTGVHNNHVDDLCEARAEWRDSNLGPDEERWLQLYLSFDKSYTRAYTTEGGPGVEIDINVHRVRVEAFLDGAVANARDPWIEDARSGIDKLKIAQPGNWNTDRPCYIIENPTPHEPLQGVYDLFDLVEIKGEVGGEAILEILVTKNALSVPIPKDVRERLDPIKRHDFDAPEDRLLAGWLRDRLVPPSRLRGGGQLQLTQIALTKRGHDE